MLKVLGTAAAVATVATGLIAGTAGDAKAAIIGFANYHYEIGSFSEAGTPDLELKLDGTTIFTLTNANSEEGNTISLATVAPAAFASLVAVLRNNASNDITLAGLNITGFPGEVTVSDFDYSPPPTTDLPGVGAIVDIFLTINEFGTNAVPFPPFGTAFFSVYDVDVSVEAIPLPGALVGALSGVAMLGAAAYRRNKAA